MNIRKATFFTHMGATHTIAVVVVKTQQFPLMAQSPQTSASRREF
jgi:hypothetical protein